MASLADVAILLGPFAQVIEVVHPYDRIFFGGATSCQDVWELRAPGKRLDHRVMGDVVLVKRSDLAFKNLIELPDGQLSLSTVKASAD